MRCSKNKFFILTVFFICMGVFAQDENSDVIDLVSQLGSAELLSSIGQEDALPISDLNGIYIYQMGGYNSVTSYTTTTNSEINIEQNGQRNEVVLNIEAKTMLQNISQNGDGNFYMEYANSSNLNLERTINQSGSDHSVIIYGSNSITEKLKFNLEGSSKSITIRNFQ